jgi:hypothetical protein
MSREQGVRMQFSVAIAIVQIVSTDVENLIGFGIAGFIASYVDISAVIILALVNSGTLSMYI